MPKFTSYPFGFRESDSKKQSGLSFLTNRGNRLVYRFTQIYHYYHSNKRTAVIHGYNHSGTLRKTTKMLTNKCYCWFKFCNQTMHPILVVLTTHKHLEELNILSEFMAQ